LNGNPRLLSLGGLGGGSFPHSLGKLIGSKSPDSLYGGSPGFSVYSYLHHPLLFNFCPESYIVEDDLVARMLDAPTEKFD